MKSYKCASRALLLVLLFRGGVVEPNPTTTSKLSISRDQGLIDELQQTSLADGFEQEAAHDYKTPMGSPTVVRMGASPSDTSVAGAGSQSGTPRASMMASPARQREFDVDEMVTSPVRTSLFVVQQRWQGPVSISIG